ncbi:MAG: hypothetical protein WD270_06565 [Acetobacterales bacterium]
MRGGPALRLLSSLIAALLWCGPADAHALLVQYELPLPLGYYLAGAGATVALSYAVVAWFLRHPVAPSLSERRLRRSPPPAVRHAGELASIALYLLLVAAGLFGVQGDVADNILPTAIWVVWWVGVAFVSVFVVDIWYLLNPLAAIARRTAKGLYGLFPDRRPLPMPAWLDVWPAAVLFLCFSWAEQVWPANAVPASLAAGVLLYSAVTWTGMALFGVEP